MRKFLIITEKATDTIIQLDHILHLEISATGTIFFNTQYADYTLRKAECTDESELYQGYGDEILPVLTVFLQSGYFSLCLGGDLTVEPKESQC